MRSKLSSHKGERYAIDVLSSDEVRALLDGCNKRYYSGSRNRAVIAVLYRCGLRVSEALALSIHDVDLDNGKVQVRRGKGGKRRTVGIDEVAVELVRHYLLTFRSTVDGSGSLLFVTRLGTPVKPVYVRLLLRRLAKRAGISKRVHPHGLRHSRAHQLEAEGVPVSIVSKILGHSSIATTSIYLDHIHPTDVVDTLRNSRWE